MVLHNSPNLQSLLLPDGTLGSVGLSELAPALCRNTSIKELDLSYNEINMESAKYLRDIIRRNKTITTLALSGTHFGRTTDAFDLDNFPLPHFSRVLEGVNPSQSASQSFSPTSPTDSIQR
jgi:hypothetical protein